MSLKGTAMTDKVLRGKITNIHQIEDVEALYAEAEDLIDRVKSVEAEYDSVVAKCDKTIDKIEQKGEEVIASIPQEYTALDAQCRRNTARIDKNEKRITNLENGIIPSPFVTDDGVAYQKEVPNGALPFAEVEKVGGMTRKCANLLNIGTLSFTKSIRITIDNPLLAGTYTLSAVVTSSGTDVEYSRAYFYDENRNEVGQGQITRGYRKNTIVEISAPCKYIDFFAETYGAVSAEDDATWADIMLNAGTTALPYEPYFKGLRSAPVTEVESVGANLWDEQWWTASLNETTGAFTYKANYAVSSKNYIPVAPNKTYFINIWCWLAYYDKDLNFVTAFEHAKGFAGGGGAFTTPPNVWFIKFQSILTDTGSVYNNNIIVNKGSTALPYSPYVRNTIPISEAVQALDGYGWGINESVYNYIDWDKKQFVKRVGKIALTGNEDWRISSLYANTAFAYDVKNKGSSLVLCNSYNYVSSFDGFANKDKVCACGSYLNVKDIEYMPETAGNAAKTWKAHLAELYASGNPVIMYYELATPIITDISDILTEDNYIGVEGGGTVTMVNEHQYAVPSSITYQVKGDA